MMKKELSFVSFILCLLMLSSAASARQITVIRHGESDHNVSKQFNSNPDHPQYFVSKLTDKGIKEVQSTAQSLIKQGKQSSDYDIVLVSPMPRTVQTAQVLAEEGLFKPDKIQVHPLLTELQMGELESSPITETAKTWEHPENKFHGGEDRNQMLARMRSFMSDIDARYPTQNILIVTHGSPSMYIIELATHQSGVQLQPAQAMSFEFNSSAS